MIRTVDFDLWRIIGCGNRSLKSILEYLLHTMRVNDTLQVDVTYVFNDGPSAVTLHTF